MKNVLLKSQIADLVLARAALCGDLTGRGSMQGDRDRAAIDYLLDSLVPDELSALGVGYTTSATGWQIAADVAAPSLAFYLADALLHSLHPGAFGRPEPPLLAAVPRLKGQS